MSTVTILGHSRRLFEEETVEHAGDPRSGATTMSGTEPSDALQRGGVDPSPRGAGQCDVAYRCRACNDGVTTAPVTVSGGTTVTFPSVPLPFPAFPPLVRTGVKVEVLTGGFVTVNP